MKNKEWYNSPDLPTEPDADGNLNHSWIVTRESLIISAIDKNLHKDQKVVAVAAEKTSKKQDISELSSTSTKDSSKPESEPKQLVKPKEVVASAVKVTETPVENPKPLVSKPVSEISSSTAPTSTSPTSSSTAAVRPELSNSRVSTSGPRPTVVEDKRKECGQSACCTIL